MNFKHYLKKFLAKTRIFKNRIKYSRTNTLSSWFVIGSNVAMSNSKVGYHSRVAQGASLSFTEVGDYSAIGRYSKITHTLIGKFCAISWDTTINAISHPYTHLTISAFPYVPYVGDFVSKRKQNYNTVVIKNDVWVGANVVVMPGVTIGNGAVIGAGAVVTCDVPDYAIVAGVPAKVIKYRFDKDIIDEMLRLNWWDLEPEIIRENISEWQRPVNRETLRKLRILCK